MVPVTACVVVLFTLMVHVVTPCVVVLLFTDANISQVNTLGTEANRLSETHPDQADEIAAKQSDILGNWQKLSQKVRSALVCPLGRVSLQKVKGGKQILNVILFGSDCLSAS